MKDNTPLISIAMATYNGEKYILEQLKSFITQTRQPDELIITDDCSTDRTVEVLKNFQKNAPFSVKIYINDTNLGYTQNFNKALQLCSGDLVFLSDQDDVWFENKIEYMMNLANSNQNKDVFMIDAELVDANLQTSGLSKQGQIRDLGLGENAFVMGCCIAVRKTFLDTVLPVPNAYKGHDDWIVRLADFLQERVIDNTILQFYRRHENNVSMGIYNNLVKAKKYSIYRVIKRTISVFKNSNTSDIEKYLKQNQLLMIGLDRLNNHLKYENKTKKIEASKKNIKDVIYVLKKRLDIIKTDKIISRVKKGWILHKDNNYDFKSFIKDILFD